MRQMYALILENVHVQTFNENDSAGRMDFLNSNFADKYC